MALTKWSDNKAAAMLQGNYDGYIQSSLLQLRLTGAIGTNPSNGAAVYNIKENTTYKVRLYMDTRFRIAACSSIAMNTVMTNYYRDAADKSDTTVAGAYKEAEITSEAGQVYMPVVYWASGGSKTWQEVYDTIEVREQLNGALTLKSAPAKLEYNVGEEIDLTGISVIVAWSDGSEDAVADYTVSGFDSSAVGTKTVTVAYLGETVTFEVTVVQLVVMTGIEVTPPTKVSYLYGEALDTAGMIVKVIYSDGTSADVTDYALSGYDANKLGEQIITAAYQGFSTTFIVTVVNAVAGIEVTPPVKLLYTIGEALDLTGMSVRAVWLDGTKTEIVDCTVSGFDSTNVGEKAITVTYKEFNTTFIVTVMQGYSLSELLNTTGGMSVIRNNTKNDSGTDAVVGVDWFYFNGTAAKTVYVNGNNWVGFGTSSEQLKVCRRDGATWYVYRQEGVLDDRRRFLKIRVEGYTLYSSTSAQYKLIYELFLFDDNNMLLNLIQTPGNPSYIGTSSLVCGGNTITLDITADSIKQINFESSDGIGSAFTVSYAHNSIKENIGSPTLGDVAAVLDLDTGELIVSGSGTTKYYSGGPVLGSYKDKVKRIVVKEGITGIGAYTFIKMINATEVILPESLTTMGYEVFEGCSALSTVYFNAIDCSCGWKYNTTYYYPFKNTAINNLIFGNAVKKIPEGLFGKVSSLSEVILPESLKTIEPYAFQSCTGLNRILIGENVTSVGTDAFAGGYSTRKTIIKKTEGSIAGAPWGDSGKIIWVGSNLFLDDDHAFAYCTDNGNADILCDWKDQTEIHIPRSINEHAVTSIRSDAFIGSSLEYIFIGLPQDSIPGEPWGGGKVFWSDTIFEKGVVYKVADGEAYVYAFYDSTGAIKDVEVKGIHEGLPVKIISGGVFNGKSLDRIILPDMVEVIESGSFVNCSADVNIPASLKKIADGAFQYSGIKNIVIPPSATELGVHIFNSCANLKKLEYKADIDVPDGFCYGAAVESIKISGNVKGIGIRAFGDCRKLLSVSLSDSIIEIKEHAFYGCSGLEEMQLPRKLERLGAMVFYNCTSLKTVLLHESLTVLDQMCFYGSGLENVTIPPGITDWGASAFADCISLKSVTLSEGLESVGRMAFQGCAALVDVEFPQSLKRIEQNAFGQCGIAGDITLFQNIEELGLNAFLECPIKTFAIMNPDCIIGDNTPVTTGSTDTVIYGYPGSTAESYTSKYPQLLKFVELCYETHTATFLDINEQVFYAQAVECGLFAGIPVDTPSTVDGFTFCGWMGADQRVMDDVAYPAIYRIETYAVQFKDHDGTVLSAQQVRYGDDATPPADPTREGYLFSGWDKPYTDISADTVITATYTQYAAVTGIELQAAYTVINGETVNIPYKVLPEAANNKGVSITVSDSTVIDTAYGSGWIICEAINTGEAVITVTSAGNSSISASCTVTVVADDVVTGISLYPPELLLQKGKTEEIAVSVTGGADVDESVVWTSSNAAVATVKNGKVKGIAEGAVTITARLKSDASFYATCSVTVEDKKDFVIDSYKNGSLHKPITIHSVDNKFADITSAYIDGESMVIKESICDSQTLKLGGCIANSFEVLILDERLHTKAPTGEIQVYQTMEGNRVNLFNGIIYKAERVGSSLTRKLVAYDKLYSKGNKDMTAWFKRLKLPMTIKQFRTLLFKQIGIKQASVALDIDKCMIVPQSYKIDMPTIDVETGAVVENKKEKIENYAISTSGIKATDIIRDLCEAAGMCGWMDRKGVFEYIDISASEISSLDEPINVTCAENYYRVKCTALKKDDLEWFEGGKYVEIDNGDIPIMAEVEYKKEVENATYILDEGNFIVQVAVVNNPRSIYHLKGLVQIMQAVHSRAAQTCQQFECQRRFNPYDKLGTIIEDKIKKETSTGKSYTWNLKSIILSRTIKGSQSMLETISAKNGPFNASNDTSRKNIKMVNVKQELAEKKISQLNATKMTGIGMTKSEFDASNIIDSNTTTYFVRFD